MTNYTIEEVACKFHVLANGARVNAEGHPDMETARMMIRRYEVIDGLSIGWIKQSKDWS